MLRCTLLSTFFLCAYGATLHFQPNLTGRIVGGEPTAIVEFPHHIGLLRNGHNIGGGSIISESIIITAFHCAYSPASFFTIRAGSSQHNSGGQVIAVSQIINHKDCSVPTRYNNDISLVFLLSKLILGTTVAPVALPSQGQTVPDDTLSIAVGWGSLSEEGGRPTQLHKLTIPIVNQQKCVDAHARRGRQVTNNMICAGNYTHGGQSVCNGDSGGSLTIDNVLIGITSWAGEGCARPGLPAVFTRVPNYTTWINEHIIVV